MTFHHRWKSAPAKKEKKKQKKERKLKKGRLVESATAVEIDKGGLRRHFLDDFHKLLGSLLASTLTTKPDDDLINQREF